MAARRKEGNNRLAMNKPLATAHPSAASRRARGFTLIELMIAVAVVGILAMVALPSLMDSIRKGRRSEAFAALASLQQAQERWRSNNASYTATLSDLGFSSANTSSGYYTLSLSNATATGYVISAEGNSGTSQANDKCRKLSVQVLGGSVKYAGCASCSSYTYAPTDACWSR
jgi:type IV pilus assembly protein PilE